MSDQQQHLSFQRAIKAARGWFDEFYDGGEIFDVRLEEFVEGDDGCWEVTFGFDRRVNSPRMDHEPLLTSSVRSPLLKSPSEDYCREFKVVRIDKVTGGFKGMVNHAVQTMQ